MYCEVHWTALRLDDRVAGKTSVIELQCPHCGHQLRIKPQFAGKRGRCKRCRGHIFVPSDAPAQPLERPSNGEVIDRALAPGVTKGYAPVDDSLGIGVPGLVHVDAEASLTSIDQLGDDFANLQATAGDKISSNAEPSESFRQPPGGVSAFANMGPLFWATVFLIPPAGFIWSLQIDKNHPQRRWAVGASIGLTILAIMTIGAGIGIARSGDTAVVRLLDMDTLKDALSVFGMAKTAGGGSVYENLPTYPGATMLPTDPIDTIEGPLVAHGNESLNFEGSYLTGSYVEIQNYYYEAFPNAEWTRNTQFGFDGDAGRYMTIVAQKDGRDLFLELIEIDTGAYVTVVTPMEGIETAY